MVREDWVRGSYRCGKCGGGYIAQFEEIYDCDAAEKYHGYNSWDHFFTRTFRENIRPVAFPEDDSAIVNSCESQPYKVSSDVKAIDKFWVKGQPYLVLEMLAHDELAEQFVGGTVYQAFLSALSYHRWHAPVSGRITKLRTIDGTYYSEPPFTTLAESNSAGSGGKDTGQEYFPCLRHALLSSSRRIIATLGLFV
jgi:phosphatidylserine decarboxylase